MNEDIKQLILNYNKTSGEIKLIEFNIQLEQMTLAQVLMDDWLEKGGCLGCMQIKDERCGCSSGSAPIFSYQHLTNDKIKLLQNKCKEIKTNLDVINRQIYEFNEQRRKEANRQIMNELIAARREKQRAITVKSKREAIVNNPNKILISDREADEILNNQIPINLSNEIKSLIGKHVTFIHNNRNLIHAVIYEQHDKVNIKILDNF